MPPKRKGNQNVATTQSKKAKMATCNPKSAETKSLKEYLSQKDWRNILDGEMEKTYFKEMEEKIKKEIAAGQDIYPAPDLIFNALNSVAPQDVKVLLLGQDPYHGEGQAMGLSFSVPRGIAIPPSLRNMYKELSSDIVGFKDPGHGCLDKWADQGVLLLNATLTVRKSEPNSHSKYGWQTFTDVIIKAVSEKNPGAVFMLWGNFAHKKEKLVDKSKHSVIKNAHPSPLSCTKFYGCKCFSHANDALKKMGRKEVDWKL